MKKTVKQVVIEKEVWLSVNGIEFDTKEKCRDYELQKLKELQSWADNYLKPLCVNGSVLGIPYTNDDDDCYLVVAEDEIKIKNINEYISFRTGESLDSPYNTYMDNSMIGKPVILFFTGDGDSCCVYEWEAHKAKLQSNMDGYIKSYERLKKRGLL